MACLAGVLIIVSYNMSEWRTFRSLMKNPKSDVSVLLVTFFLTVIFDLTIAIEVGLLIAMFLFMKRVAETTHVSVVKMRSISRTMEKSTMTKKSFPFPKVWKYMKSTARSSSG